MERIPRLLVGIVALASVTGCSSVATLSVASKAPIQDQSVPTPQKAAYSIVMVLPPKGSERGEVSELAGLEKELLRQGVRVISSGVTGRVVIDNAGGQKNESAAQLTDLERALILARKSGAEALLQVANMEWAPDAANDRYFLLDGETEAFVEVTKAEFDAAPPSRQWKMTGPSLVFEAKLIDVESGEIVAAIDLRQSTPHEVASKLVNVAVKHGTIVDPGAHETPTDTPDLRHEAAGELMSKLAKIIAQGKPRDARPSAKEIALEADRKKVEEERAALEAERKRMAEEEAKRIEDERKRAEEEAAKRAEAEAAAKKPPKKK